MQTFLLKENPSALIFKLHEQINWLWLKSLLQFTIELDGLHTTTLMRT